MATISSLSTEILADILSYIPRYHGNLMRAGDILPGSRIIPPSPSKLPPYATVCKTWQWHIEQRTFRGINLLSTELEYFSKVMTGNRKAALRAVQYHIVLPEYDDAACEVVETEEDREVNNSVFTTAIVELFRVVKGWEEEEKELSGRDGLVPLSLEISQIYSPSDAQKQNKTLYRELGEAVNPRERRDLLEERHWNSWLRLGQLEDVPELKSVAKYHFRPTYPRAVRAESIARLANKFPALEKLAIQILERGEDLEVRRRDRYSTYEDLFFAVLKSSVLAFPLTQFGLWEATDAGNICPCCRFADYRNVPLTVHRFCCRSPSPRLAPSHFFHTERRHYASALHIARAPLDPTSLNPTHYHSLYRPLLYSAPCRLPRPNSQDYRPQRPYHPLPSAFPASCSSGLCIPES